MNSLYSEAIQNRNLQQVSEIFHTELNKFIKKENEIYLQWVRTDESDHRTCNHLKYLYSQHWEDFTQSVPFQVQMRYDGEDGCLSLTDIINNEHINSNDKNLCTNLIEQIVRYSAYIISKLSSQLLWEQVVWQSLYLTNQMLDVTTMIHPEDVVKMADKVIKQIEIGRFRRPQASIYKGVLYPYRLTKGEKTRINRKKIIQEWLEDLMLIYKDKYKRKPTISESREYIVSCCITSDIPQVQLFTDGINYKTFRYYAKGFRLSRSRRTKKNKKTTQTRPTSKCTDNIADMVS